MFIEFSENHKISIYLQLFLYLILGVLLSSSMPLQAQSKSYVVVIDAGHGGKDPGNLGNGFKEKNIALKVALAVGKSLSASEDIVVKYTRTKDVFVELHDRAKIANGLEADLFLSIHCDSHTSNAYGAGTFVLGLRGNRQNLEIAKRENSVIFLEEDYKKNYDYDPNSPELMISLSLLQEENLDKSLQIASYIQNNFANKLKRHDRKVKQDNFLVLRNTVMPSVLVELGFLTNKKEGRYLNSKAGQQAMAKAIADAVKKYIKELQLNTIAVTETVIDKGPTKPKVELAYKVQIASSKKMIQTKSYNFKGLSNIERVKVGSYYKYYYGESSSYTAAKKALEQAKAKGYRSAFLVAFKNGEKISIDEALKLE